MNRIMKIGLLNLFVLLLTGTNYASAQMTLSDLRQLYLESVDDEEKTEEFMTYMSSQNQADPFMLAYLASAQSLVAKHASGLYNKMKYLKLGDKSFEQAISMNAKDAEIRFLRFSVQRYLPKFLGFSDDITKDLDVLVKNIGNTKSITDYPEWSNKITNAVIDSEYCTELQIKDLKAISN